MNRIELEKFLCSRIFGQEEALKIVAREVDKMEHGFNCPGRPKASFLCAGPTGVGKTETVKALAKALYHDKWASHLVKFDMSEYKERLDIKRFVGDVNGYDERTREGLIYEKVQKCADGGIFLFDEIEKAHQDITDLFLQMLDEARLTTATSGHVLDLSNWYFFVTTNLGSRDTIDLTDTSYESMRIFVDRKAKEYFAPEKIGRFTDLLVFKKLDEALMKKIARKNLDDHLPRWQQTLKRPIIAEEAVVTWLYGALSNDDAKLGGRRMEKFTVRTVENTLRAWEIENGEKRPEEFSTTNQKLRLIVNKDRKLAAEI